jgi:sec-independent protein translocase protein TatB
MLNLGFFEMIAVAAIALVAIGPKQLPEVARTIGRMLNEFKRTTGDFTRSIVEARDSTSEMLSMSEPHKKEADPAAHAAVDPQSVAPVSEHEDHSEHDPYRDGHYHHGHGHDHANHTVAQDDHQQMSFDLAKPDSQEPERKGS